MLYAGADFEVDRENGVLIFTLTAAGESAWAEALENYRTITAKAGGCYLVVKGHDIAGFEQFTGIVRA